MSAQSLPSSLRVRSLLRNPRVLLAGKLTGLTAPGGGETQLKAMVAALQTVGVEASFWRPWEDSLAEADCIHLFGSEPEHLPVIKAAAALKKPLVVSPIAWFDLQSLWREPWPLPKRLFACGKFLARRQFPRIPSWRRELYQSASMLLPNSKAEAAQLSRHFGVPFDRIHVVPNGADVRFAAGCPRAFALIVGGEGYVLCAGRIEPRKNQLAVIRALRGSGARLVILGDPLAEHHAYYAACRKAADQRTTFVPAIFHNSDLLKSAYAAAGCVVLASWYETPGLVALEAGMSGTPLVLPRGGCANEYFGAMAEYVGPRDEREIREAILRALAKPRSSALAEHVQQHFTWEAAARATKEAYEKVL